MFIKFKNFFSIFILVFLFFYSNAFGQIINKIEVKGNERVSNDTIIMFTGVNISDEINNQKINLILKNLYNTNFFENISVELDKDILTIIVKEYPIIQNISFDGLKAKKNKEIIKKNLLLKNRSSYNKFFLEQDKKTMSSTLKELGYYFSEIETYVEFLDDNKVNITHKIDLGEKAKIKKISFIGNKIFKNSKLKNVILSEEYKFWKFISGKKFLNEQLIELDKRLLKNFYLNKGYYNVIINTSFAKLIDDNSFELIFNIKPDNKVYFNDLNIIYPNDFDDKNFESIKKLLSKSKDKPYSINLVNYKTLQLT